MGLFFVGEAKATTYYVDQATGSDSRAGTSTSTAWATIGKANATLRAGDTVYVRAGTYNEILEPYQSGTAGAPITYQNYAGETAVIRGEAGMGSLVAVGTSYHGPSGPRSYIIVDGFTLRHINPKGVSSRPKLVWVNDTSSRYNVIRNCTIQAQGTATFTGGIEDAILVLGAQHTTIENNHISGYARLGVVVGGLAQYTTIRGNDIRNCQRSSIDLGSSEGTMQYTLIENNLLDGSAMEDGIQLENNYNLPAGTLDADSNRGVVIRNNIIANHAENSIDLKGGAYVIIEGNVMYGAQGNDNGGLDPSYGNTSAPGAHTIMHGSGAGSRNVIIRRNVLYDGPGGILPENYYKIYHNTILYNNRDYTGPNSSWGGATSKPTFTGIAAWQGRDYVGIKNNIVGGHNAADIAIQRTATTLDIDYNLYFNDAGALLVDMRAKYDWSAVPFSQWPSFLTSQGVPGADAHSRQAAPLLVNAPADLTGPSTRFDFHLQAGSPAIDHGGFLTTTTAAGQGTSVTVKDAGYFFDGYGIVAGDTIQLQGQTATARIVSISSNTLVVDKSLTWSAGQGVSLAYQGSAPDIGAYEYGGGSPATYMLAVIATNGTVTKTPNQTSYTAGQAVTLQATPNTGYTFSGWSGDLTGAANPATLVMDANKSVTANFTAAAVTYTLSVSVTNGTVTKTPDQTSYTSGQTVTLQATASTGYTFSGWSGDLTGTTNPATLTMNANKSVTANFTAAAVTYTLSVSATNGAVTKTPNQTSYTSGQTVMLQATPSTGYTFSGWSGDLTGTTNPATLVMNANKSVTANFTAVTYSLAISATNGAVTKTPDQTSYTSGQTVTLQATPNAGYTFSGWSGDLTGTTNPATLTMNANKSVTATFAAVQPAVYYVDRGAGNDNNDGKSPATAWRSLAKVNSYAGFIPGDQILLHRGHIWREQLIVPASGTANKPLLIGAYDTGNRPLLKGSTLMRGWTSAGTNQWQAALSTQPDQVFFDGVRGTRMASQAALTGPQQWYWVSGVLYVYATSDPGSLYIGPGVEASISPATRTSGLIQIQDRSYVTVQGLEVTQSSSVGICLASSGQGITIKDCEADNSVDGGIVATSPTVALSNLTIDGCLVHHNNSGLQEGALGVATYQEGLTLEGVSGFAVRGCQIYSNYALGVSLKHGAANGIVENCQVNSNGLLNFYLDGASQITIRYNKIYDCAQDAGIKLGLETSTYDNDSIRIYSNLFWNNANDISFTANSGVTTQTRNLSIYDNTFYNGRVVIRWKPTATGYYSGTNAITNNILWPQGTTGTGISDETTGQQGIAQTAIAYNAFPQGVLSDTTGTNARVITDPSFVNPSGYDFHLKAGSLCIDAGTNVGLTRDFDGAPVPQGGAPDLGAYEYAGFATYTLQISAANGTVTKVPNQTSYTSGQTVTLQATPNTGYTFSGWSGDLTGTTNPATLVMDTNKSVTANFTAIPVTYTLAISATNGTVTKTPNQTSYTSGQTVTLQATPNTGYTFSGWSGNLTGTANPATLVVNANKSVTANFTAVTYSLAVSATNGTVTKTPNQTSYTSGQTVTLQATPNTGYRFSGWSGDLTGTANPATLVMDSNKSVTAGFTLAPKATVYYVDRGAGNDKNDGKSPATAWRSLAKVNSYTGFVPGDQILLHRGHIWREQLIVPTSGAAGNPLVIGAYDTGNRPLLKGSALVRHWTKAGTNQWKASLSTLPNQVFFNGVRGTLMTSQARLTGPGQWYWAAGALYVYATSDPDSLHTGPGVEASISPATRTSGLIQIQDRSYVTVQDLEVTQSYSVGICLASSGQGLTVRNCAADYAADGGIVATSEKVALSDVTVEGCLVHHNNGGLQEGALGVATYQEGLTVEGVNGFAVRGCEIYSNYALGVSLKHGATNGVFENCQVHSNELLNFYQDGASQITIRYNKIYDCAQDAGIKFGLETSTYDNDSIRIYSNLFWNNANGISFTANSGVTTQTRNLSIYDNTFYNSRAVIRWKPTATGYYSGTNAITNNILWPQGTTSTAISDETTGQQGIAQTTIAYNAFPQGVLSDTTGTNARLITDPSFANPSGYDFHLKAGSLCIDAGTNVGLTRDFDGAPVPQGGAPDVGAFEYGAATSAAVAATSVPVAGSATGGTAKMLVPVSAALGDAALGTPTAPAPAPGSMGVAPNVATSSLGGVASPTDQLPPVLGDCSPAPDSIQASPDALVVLHVRDAGQGVDGASVAIRVGGNLVYTGDVDSERTAYGVCYRSGTKADLTYTYQPQRSFGYSKEVTVAVEARDLAGNVMREQTYSFATEMYSFGINHRGSVDQMGLAQGRPATVRDGQGNVWIVWHAGNPGSRHVYAARFESDGESYGGTVQLSHGAGDHCHPAIAVDGAGTLYVVWQENASGAWDVCVSTSVDGQTWSASKSLAATMGSRAQPAVNRINPVIAAGGSSGGLVAAAWQEDQAGNQDIYVARSTNRFQTATISRVTSDPADQIDPALAIDGQDTIFVLWTDARNGSADIYGAASDAGPWTNVPVVDGESNQSHCAVAVGTTGRTLHVAWVEDKAGDLDVFYAASEGLPMSPVTGANIIDDSSGADQQASALTVAAGADGTDHVFVCWEDARNVAYSGATDLYFADVGSGAVRINVLLDDGAGGNRHEAALGTDRWGYPYVVWVGDSTTGLQLHYSGATYANPVPLAERQIVSSAGGLVGTSPQKIRSLDDVSVAIPARTCPIDATIRAARIRNPRWPAGQSPSPMAFGPGGLVFTQPVTVTIPYSPVGRGAIRVYWFDAATGTFRQDGIANTRSIHAASGLAALQFETTHLGSFYLVSGTMP